MGDVLGSQLEAAGTSRVEPVTDDVLGAEV